MSRLSGHHWVDDYGLPWTPFARTDLCSRCRRTPDVHPRQKPRLTKEQVDWITERIGHRLDWVEQSHPPSDLRHLVTLLVDHAKASTRRAH